MSPDQRRETIVAAALEVMLEKGIAATTVRDITGRLGVSSGLVHHYTDSMDTLIADAFARAAAQDLGATAQAVGTATSPTQRLVRFFDSYARTDQDWAFQLWLDAWAEASRRPALRATSRELTLAWHRLLADLIDEGVADGSLRCTDPGGTAWRILSLLDGLALQTVANGAALDRDVTLGWARRHAEGELGLAVGTLDPC